MRLRSSGEEQGRLWPEFPQLPLRPVFLGPGRGRDAAFGRAELWTAEEAMRLPRGTGPRAATGCRQGEHRGCARVPSARHDRRRRADGLEFKGERARPASGSRGRLDVLAAVDAELVLLGDVAARVLDGDARRLVLLRQLAREGDRVVAAAP